MKISKARRPVSRWSPACRLILLALAASESAALSQEYCASFNTGLAKKAGTDNYMTNGKCHDQCSGYAFAIVQEEDCFCSNYAPGDTSSQGACNHPCPGYPYENCGDKAQGLFGYIALGPAPSGTQGGSSSSSSPTQAAKTQYSQPTTSPDPSPITLQDTVTATQSVFTSVVSVTPSTSSTISTPSTSQQPVLKSITLDKPTTIYTPTASSTPSTPPTPQTPTTTLIPTPSSISSSSSSTSSTWTPIPVLSVMTVTGQVMTLTVTPTAPPAATHTVVRPADTEKSQGFFTSSGKVAGVFVAVAVAVLLIAAGLIFLCWRKRKQNDSTDPLPSTAGSGTPQRRPSRLSQMGLLGGSQREKGSNPTIVTSGWGPGTGAEKSPAETLDHRSSYPRVVDQRLEPTAVWNPLHDNGSHISVRSFRDDQDYSRRMLRIANPDD